MITVCTCHYNHVLVLVIIMSLLHGAEISLWLQPTIRTVRNNHNDQSNRCLSGEGAPSDGFSLSFSRLKASRSKGVSAPFELRNVG